MFPGDLEFDYHDGFQVSTWLTLGEEKEMKTIFK